MKYASCTSILGLLVCPVFGSETTTSAGWPTLRGTVDQALQRADGAFRGTLEFFDVEKKNQNMVMASGRIVPREEVWGELPALPIELGRQTFLIYGGSSSGFGPWSLGLTLDQGVRSVSLLVLYKQSEAVPEILHVVFPERKGATLLAEDLLAIRQFESEPDGELLRNKLIDAVLAPKSGELLWSYALRKLYSLEDNTGRRFDLVLSERVQRSGSSRRLWYAIRLLTGQIGVVTPKASSREEIRSIIYKLLRTFETAPSSNMANVALGTFIDNPARIAQFTEAEWADIRVRVRAVCDDLHHPIHQLDDYGRGKVNNILERLLSESDLLKPQN